MEPTEQVSEKQREIVRGAATVFAQYGYHKTSMNDIIGASRVSRATVYKYFGSKEDVFRAVIWQEKKEAVKAIEGAVAAEASTRGKLKAMFTTSLRMLDEKMNLYRLTRRSFTELFPPKESEEGELKARMGEVIEILTEILGAGVAAGDLVVKDTELVVEVFLAAFRGIMVGAFAHADRRPPDELAEAMVDVFLDGLRARSEA